MKSLSCKDMGGEMCDFTATGETVEEVKGKMYEHAQQAHADKLASMTEEQKAEMDKKIDGLIRDV